MINPFQVDIRISSPWKHWETFGIVEFSGGINWKLARNWLSLFKQKRIARKNESWELESYKVARRTESKWVNSFQKPCTIFDAGYNYRSWKRNRTLFWDFAFYCTTIIHKIFKGNSSFHVKIRTTGKVQFLFFRRFLLVLTKFSFREKD